MLLKEVKNIYHKELGGIYPKEEVDSFFYLVIEHYLKLERFVLVLEPNLVITKEQEKPLFEVITGLKEQQPIQYILGKSYFMDMDFLVGKDVLIPRPETEELVRWILDYCTTKQNQNITVLDIGTGSGCIAISLAKNIPNAKVYAVDISQGALEIAKRNADLNAVAVSFLKVDILKPELETITDLKFDIIVSNPPYVRELEKKEMHKNVLDYEPDNALFVADDKPLIFYKAIADFAQNKLNVGGKLFLEINQYLGKETVNLLQTYNFLDIELRKDMYGNDRMIYCKV